jgi:hypothetical protein
MKKTHYQKATDEIIKAAKELKCYSCPEWKWNQPDFRRARKLIIEMLKANFISKKAKWN